MLGRLMPDLPGYEPNGGPVIPQAVIVRQSAHGPEVLLVKRTSPRAWELPGGYAETGESPEQALVREAREETGLTVHPERLVGWYERTGFRPHRSPVFLCSFTTGAPVLSHEAVAIRFFPVGRLPLGLLPWYRGVIQDATSGKSFATPRVQRLGFWVVAASALIHVAERLGILA